MKMHYRGIEYDYSPETLPIVEGETIGKYRGAELHAHKAQVQPTPRYRSGYRLKYRGVDL